MVDELAILATGSRRNYLNALLAYADRPSLIAATAFARRRHLMHRMILITKEKVMSCKARGHVWSAGCCRGDGGRRVFDSCFSAYGVPGGGIAALPETWSDRAPGKADYAGESDSAAHLPRAGRLPHRGRGDRLAEQCDGAVDPRRVRADRRNAYRGVCDEHRRQIRYVNDQRFDRPLQRQGIWGRRRIPRAVPRGPRAVARGSRARVRRGAASSPAMAVRAAGGRPDCVLGERPGGC